MSDLKSIKNKHMTLDDRSEIQTCLDRGMTFKAIAKRIAKDQTTVSKEVKKHITVNTNDIPVKTNLNGKPAVISPCPELLKVPFVCNGCKKRRSRCAFQKSLYIAKNAQQEYASLLEESREGIPLVKMNFM
jgi:IS30 family transposase